jgi:hypothetical protein
MLQVRWFVAAFEEPRPKDEIGALAEAAAEFL